uniref:Oxidized purine nucleoside triphosphate hydrolase n=1 Tax=Schistosoma haematobium TaxID=6185 RepID=A0A095B2E5_SCHHA
MPNKLWWTNLIMYCNIFFKYDDRFIKVQESITDCNKSWLLLGLKQSGFGQGRWNGFGGKVELSDANPKAAALRELNEESGLTLDESSVDEVGRLWFTFAETLECMEVHVFICRTWTPTFNGHTVKWPCYTEEMHPAWFPLIMNKDNTINASSLPWEHMWPDDLLWVPDILQGNLILAWFHYLRLSNLSITNSQNLIDRSTETNGISIDLYEIPAYHLESFTTDENELLSADKDCMEVHVFICRTWTPTFNGHTVKWPCYTEEMHPAWFPLIMNKDNTINASSLPWEHMWPDDLLWVPDILQGNLILAWFHYLRLSNLSITNSQNLIDRSTETNGISIDLYEIPAYHLESFTTDENELLSADKDNDCKLSSVQRIIDRLDLDKNDNNLRLWMSSSLYDNEFVVSPLILQKILHYPI